MKWLDIAKSWARSIKRDVAALWIAARDPRVPMHVKISAAAVAAFALSPIDLIPDFVPILGYLDDLLIVPLGIALVVRMIDPALMAEFRFEALSRGRPVSRAGLIIVVMIFGHWRQSGSSGGSGRGPTEARCVQWNDARTVVTYL